MLDIYKASAGSGKTYTLTHRYIDMLLAHPSDPRPHSHILAVTFTKKATAEMKHRIIDELNKAGDNTEQRRVLINILQDYTHFAVSTIDGFFQLVVRLFARELGLPALFNLTLDTNEVVNEAVDQLTFKGYNEWLRDYVRDNIRSGKNWNPKENIRTISQYLMTEEVHQLLPLIQDQLDDVCFMRAYKSRLQEAESAEKCKPKKEQDFTASIVLAHLNELGTLSAIARQIEETNKEQNRLPISDINHLLLRITQSIDAAFVYEKLGTRYHHFMIDEFQDTSALQWLNFMPLIVESNANGHANLIVGDVKQSIYRWRNSDWKLLATEVEKQIADHRLPPMDTNYRSSAVVVNANNDIFERYLDWAANHLDEDLKSLNESSRSTILRDSYSTLRQKPHSTEPGYVHLEFFPVAKRNEANEAALDRLPAIIDDLIKRHIPMKEIAIIVRFGREAQEVARFLIEHNYPIQTAEGLLLASHPVIEIIVCLLSLTLTPEDTLIKARLQLALNKIQGELHTQQEGLEVLPLYDLVQSIIDEYHLADVPGAIPYLTTFQDLVYSFVTTSPAHVASFLDYWHQRESSATIPASSAEAISITTIHKAKGLEWQAVIIPFCSWPYAKSKLDSDKLLWIDTRNLSTPHSSLYKELSLLPIQFTKNLLNSDFKEAYADELLSLYLDNLNLTYVAFTRAKNELYVFGQDVHSVARKSPYPSVDYILSELYPEGLEMGEKQSFVSKQRLMSESSCSDGTTILNAIYHSEELGDRLRLRTRVLQNETDQLDIRDLGIVMHDWLAEITVPEDKERSLQKLIAAGQVREADLPDLTQRMEDFLSFADQYDWFKPHEQVLCEKDILLPSGHTQRPDRVMIDGKRAVIIDYKFGSEHKQTYQEQVRDYVSYFESMGYTTEGYIVYVTLQKVDKV